MNIKGKICILKKTYPGNTHDENWQNHIYVIDEKPWEDKFDEICKTGYGWFFDPPIIERYNDASECMADWEEYNCDYSSWEIFTCEDMGHTAVRRVYGVKSDSIWKPHDMWFDMTGNIAFRDELFLKSEETDNK